MCVCVCVCVCVCACKKTLDSIKIIRKKNGMLYKNTMAGWGIFALIESLFVQYFITQYFITQYLCGLPHFQHAIFWDAAAAWVTEVNIYLCFPWVSLAPSLSQTKSEVTDSSGIWRKSFVKWMMLHVHVTATVLPTHTTARRVSLK